MKLGSQELSVTEALRVMAETTPPGEEEIFIDTVQHIANGWSKAPIVEFQEGMIPSREQLTELFNKTYSEYATISKCACSRTPWWLCAMGN